MEFRLQRIHLLEDSEWQWKNDDLHWHSYDGLNCCLAMVGSTGSSEELVKEKVEKRHTLQ
jgi:hypothetical protein